MTTGCFPPCPARWATSAIRAASRPTFEVVGRAPDLSPEQQLVLYRVTQESLSNVAQHAEAVRVRVKLSFEGGIRLSITDDGAGLSLRRRPMDWA